MKSLDVLYLTVILILSNVMSYQHGSEDGYWEHEAEENAYSCEVLDEWT